MLWFLALLAFSDAAAVTKIRGGSNTTIERVPWQVMLNVNGVLLCGGSIISENYVLTTASCVYRYQPYLLTVRSGTSFLLEGGTDSEVERVISHPVWNREDYDYDVAVLKLKNPLNFTESQKAVRLSLDRVENGSLALVSGWGYGLPSGLFAEVIQAVMVPVTDQQQCADVYEVNRIVTDRMVCAGAVGKDACGGDAGDALTQNDIQVGIVSWGYGCGEPGFPGVYTNIPAVKEFIDEYSNNEASWVNLP